MKTKIIIRFLLLIVIIASSHSVCYALPYDDFNGNSIHSNLWTVNDRFTIFSQSDGSLHANMGTSTGEYATLTSASTISGDFQLVVNFNDFYFNGFSFGDTPELTLFVKNGDGGTSGEVDVKRFIRGPDGIISSDSGNQFGNQFGTALYPASSDSGQMMITRTSSNISTFYNEGTEWKFLESLPDSLQGDLTFGLEVYTGDGGTFHVDVDSVELNAAPVPEPATTLLLGLGLVGIAAFKKRFDKRCGC